jgi:hypothetical protein
VPRRVGCHPALAWHLELTSKAPDAPTCEGPQSTAAHAGSVAGGSGTSPGNPRRDEFRHGGCGPREPDEHLPELSAQHRPHILGVVAEKAVQVADLRGFKDYAGASRSVVAVGAL